MSTSGHQKELLNLWAAGTDFVLDSSNQPKVEFARLAKVKGWVGGDANWREHWHACFGEDYRYGARHATTTTTKSTPGGPTPTAAPDLVELMRRLSVSSNESSFSIISACPSLQSVDSIESITGGVAVLQLANFERRDQQADQTTAAVASAPTPANASKDNAGSPRTLTSTSQASPFWYQFPGFIPNPTATFKDEFARLAKEQAWGTKTKRKVQTSALKEEVAFYYGTCMQKLASWQELCEEVGIEDIPTSITKCRKALQSVFVNLYNLIDHRRNPEVAIVHFPSYGSFARNVRAGNQFPRECAKQGGFIKVLLRKL